VIGPEPGNVPLAVYVHIPWCVHKCPYCDFNSHALKTTLPEKGYVRALLEDLDEQKALAAGRKIGSIFIGGGTPSLFSGEAIDALLTGIRGELDFAQDIEITLEANPGAVDADHFAAYRAAGVNRLSIGVQSFNAEHLRALGRIHDPAQALHAYIIARAAGFENINLDLMFGLPGQHPDQALDDLQQAVDLAPQHLSWYQLTIEPNTLFITNRLPRRMKNISGKYSKKGRDFCGKWAMLNMRCPRMRRRVAIVSTTSTIGRLAIIWLSVPGHMPRSAQGKV